MGKEGDKNGHLDRRKGGGSGVGEHDGGEGLEAAIKRWGGVVDLGRMTNFAFRSFECDFVSSECEFGSYK
jgi:hypothetical protein